MPDERAITKCDSPETGHPYNVKLAGQDSRDERTDNNTGNYHESPVNLRNNFPVILLLCNPVRVNRLSNQPSYLDKSRGAPDRPVREQERKTTQYTDTGTGHIG